MLKLSTLSVACAAAISSPLLAGPEPAMPSATFDESVPAALVSPEGLAHRALGEALFGSLLPEHQLLIEAAGGLGPRQTDSVGLGVTTPSDDSVKVPEPEDIIDAQTLAMMNPVHVEMMRSLARRVRAQEPIPAMCLAPDTDPKVAEAFQTFLDAIWAGTERYQYGGRWSRTTLSGGSLVIGEPTTITYSYVPDGTQVPDLFGSMRNSNMQSWLNGLYGAGTWEGLFDTVFARWSFLTGISYVYEPNDDGADHSNALSSRGVSGVRGDVRIGATTLDGASGVLAFNFFPDYGDMVLDSADSYFNSTQQQYRRFKNVVSHEHGHGLGAAHVCPTNSTKLMEPFINTNFVGPQLDDRLFGQRAYGDPLEDNDTLGTATDIGNIDPGNSPSFAEISIDDNSDVDYFQFTVTNPVLVTVSLTPAAASYLNGPQNANGSCSNGTTKNYQTIHDLQVEFFDGSGASLGVVNNSAAGVVETAQFEYFSPGTYTFAVSGDTTNDIQLYDMDVSSALTVAPLLFELTSAPGAEVLPDATSAVSATVDLRDDTFVSAPELAYSIDGAAEVVVAMADQGAGLYDATLPAMPCGSSAVYEVRAEGIFAGPVVLGPNTAYASLGVARATSFSDTFETDQGWTVSGSITNPFFGLWERATPTSTTPGSPVGDGDGSGQAYVTSNDPSLGHVSGGDTILTSPTIDMTATINPVVNVTTWFDDDEGLNPSVNVFLLEISNDNGGSWTTLDILGPGTADSIGGWIPRSYTVRDAIAPTGTMRVRAVASDANGSSFYEAGIDGFGVEDVDCGGGCPADLNGDGVVDNGDIGAFINLFLAADLAVDFNGDGIIDNGDIGQFIVVFLAGC
ncbi:MAG: hypothetical protein ACI89L_001230 [Phycisphaerales bacterium]|jgi:hypothetical protein